MNVSEEDKKHWGMDKLTGGGSRLRGCFGDRRMILFIVFIALFLDNMLLTVVSKFYQKNAFFFLEIDMFED